MTETSEMSLEELQAELKKKKALLEDVQYERAFLGKQAGMHINASEFSRLDRDAEAAEKKIAELEEAIATKGG